MGFFKKFKEAWLASMTFDRLDDDFYEERRSWTWAIRRWISAPAPAWC